MHGEVAERSSGRLFAIGWMDLNSLALAWFSRCRGLVIAGGARLGIEGLEAHARFEKLLGVGQ